MSMARRCLGRRKFGGLGRRSCDFSCFKIGFGFGIEQSWDFPCTEKRKKQASKQAIMVMTLAHLADLVGVREYHSCMQRNLYRRFGHRLEYPTLLHSRTAFSPAIRETLDSKVTRTSRKNNNRSTLFEKLEE